MEGSQLAPFQQGGAQRHEPFSGIFITKTRKNENTKNKLENRIADYPIIRLDNNFFSRFRFFAIKKQCDD
jgi:hypothetical protein